MNSVNPGDGAGMPKQEAQACPCRSLHPMALVLPAPNGPAGNRT